MNQTQVAALIAELNAMPAGLYSCDANGSACTSYVAQWKVVELVEKHAALQSTAPQPAPVDDVLTWAVSRWEAEVKNRPLINKNRRPLDDAWRQVVRFAGGDPEKLLGPSHDELLGQSPAPQTKGQP